MGQVCSRRKRKLSTDLSETVSAQSTIDTAPDDSHILRDKLGEAQLADLTAYWSYLKGHRVSVKQEELADLFDESKTSITDRFNMYLMDYENFSENIKSMASSVEFRKVVFPVFFEFSSHMELFPAISGSLFRVSSRPQLIGWYLKQCIGVLTSTAPTTGIAYEHAKTIMAFSVRLLLGKSPKPTVPTDIGETVSEAIGMLLSFHRVILISQNIGVDFEKLITMKSGELADAIMQKCETAHQLSELLAHIGTRQYNYTDLIAGIREEYPELNLGLVAEMDGTTIDQVIVKWLVEGLERPALTHRTRKGLYHHWRRTIDIIEHGVIKSENEKIIKNVIFSEIPVGKDELKILTISAPVKQTAGPFLDIAEAIADFFGVSKRFSLKQLRQLSSASRDQRDLFLESVLKTGFKQWLKNATENSSQYVMTMKGTDFWWSHLLPQTEALNSLIPSDMVYEILGSEIFHFATINEFGPHREMHVGNDRVATTFRQVLSRVPREFVRTLARTFLVSSDTTADIKSAQIFLNLMIPSQYIEHELSLISTLEAVRELLFSTSMAPPPKGRNIINMIQTAISDKDRTRRAGLVAHSVQSGEYMRLNNLISLENMIRCDRKRIFDCLFVFNSLAFLQTEKVQNLCRMVNVEQSNNPVWVQILHYAAAAYVETGEVEGALSLVGRLVNEFRYADSWRLVICLKHKLGHVPADLMNSAISLCPISELDSMLRLVAPVSSPPRDVGKVDYRKDFPNLNDERAVEEFVARIGPGFVSFETAQLLSSINSLVDSSDFVASIRQSALLSC